MLHCDEVHIGECHHFRKTFLFGFLLLDLAVRALVEITLETPLVREACPYQYCNRQECCGCTDTTLPSSICESSSR